jgi:hypothetical protein
MWLVVLVIVRQHRLDWSQRKERAEITRPCWPPEGVLSLDHGLACSVMPDRSLFLPVLSFPGGNTEFI